MELILSTAVTLFIVLDPFGNLAMFHTVLSNTPEERRPRILVRELLIALLVLMLFLFCGQPLLHFLRLEQATLLLSGGVILFLVSLGMVFPSKSVLGGDNDEEPFIVPLAIPLVAGPSALILLLILAKQYHDQIGMIAIATFSAWLVAAVILLASPFFMRFLGKKGTRALERLMGMLLVMISIQMFMDGLAGYLGEL
ncbi:MAG: YhgN family NAAT transporter [Akkermansiaceae bacterium]|nr:YhgN family NAAT transporter [Akkermansiaceae bacterium]